MSWLSRWADRRTWRDLARSYEEEAGLCRRNAFPVRESNGIIPGSDYWNGRALTALDTAGKYRDKERALRR